jgi:crotonobetainyl-CoA:carnitine CoA-transferase CaiB-like acyl-CoA transferase
MQNQALEGLKVVEFSQGMAGPWIGRMLAWCGAEVVRIESHRVPGVVRLYIPPRSVERNVEPEMSPWFTDWDAGKLFVSIDLKRPEGVEIAKRLVARCDLVVENHRHGAMEKLGLGWEELRAVNPALIGISSSGFGDSGKHPEYVSWGPNIEAMSGMAWLSGMPEGRGAMTQYAYPDSLSAMHGLFAILCALEYRERSGEGQHISLAQLETTIAMIGPEMMYQFARGQPPPKLGNASHEYVPQDSYPCKGEDRWCAISITREEEWRALCNVIDRPSWAREARFADAEKRRQQIEIIDAEIRAWTSLQDAWEAAEILQAAGIPAGAVQNAEDQYRRDEHLAERGFFEKIPHLKHGEVVATGIPLGLTGTPGHTRRAGAAMGEDNRLVFRELLGLSETEYADYVAAGAIEEGSLQTGGAETDESGKPAVESGGPDRHDGSA